MSETQMFETWIRWQKCQRRAASGDYFPAKPMICATLGVGRDGRRIESYPEILKVLVLAFDLI
jgi:hypothetical protein